MGLTARGRIYKKFVKSGGKLLADFRSGKIKLNWRTVARLGEGEVTEMIIATNPTVEGDATAHFLAEMAVRHGVQASRIAHGVPLGGELEYVDGGTLSHAFYGRRILE